MKCKQCDGSGIYENVGPCLSCKGTGIYEPHNYKTCNRCIHWGDHEWRKKSYIDGVFGLDAVCKNYISFYMHMAFQSCLNFEEDVELRKYKGE